MEEEKKLEALCRLAVVFDAKFPQVRQEEYLDALDHIRAEHIIWACKEAAKRFEFFPVPAKIIDLANAAPRKVVKAIEYFEPVSEEQRMENMRKLDELMKTFDKEG